MKFIKSKVFKPGRSSRGSLVSPGLNALFVLVFLISPASQPQSATPEQAASVQPTPIAAPYHKEPKLVIVNTNTVNFEAATNYAPVQTESIQILNFGGGNLVWSANASQPWIVLSSLSGIENDDLIIGVNTAGLRPGSYSGSVTILRQPSLASPEAISAIQEQVTIPVELVLLPDKETRVYLPFANK